MTKENEIIALILKNFPVLGKGELSVSEPLEEQGIDSLDLSTLLFAVEEKFGRRIPTDKVSSLRSIRDIADFVETT